jgi:hypothetical protein
MGASKPLAPEVGDDGFLADEFVLDDVADTSRDPPAPRPSSRIAFAAPSDAPPRPPSVHTPVSTSVHMPGAPGDGVDLPPPVRYAAIGLALVAAAGALWLVRPASPAGESVAAPGSSAPRHLAAEAPAVEPAVPEQRVDAVEPATGPSAIPEAVPGASASPSGDARALEAKHASQVALEKGRTADAIEAGERSVAIDPADAEAWLILGAAYDQRGTYAKGRACFKSCVDLATRGPRGECAALLR